MMREIKFRAFYKGERYPIFEGGLEGYEKPRMIYNIQDIYDGSGADDSGNGVGHVSCFGSFLDDEDYIVGQYTGLKDVNGVDIYEGDIVEVNYNVVPEVKIITYHNASFGIRDNEMGFVPLAIFERPSKNLIVIGNIYENPELLGDSQ